MSKAVMAQNKDLTLVFSIQKGKHNLRKRKSRIIHTQTQKTKTKVDTHSHSPQDLSLS